MNVFAPLESGHGDQNTMLVAIFRSGKLTPAAAEEHATNVGLSRVVLRESPNEAMRAPFLESAINATSKMKNAETSREFAWGAIDGTAEIASALTDLAANPTATELELEKIARRDWHGVTELTHRASLPTRVIDAILATKWQPAALVGLIARHNNALTAEQRATAVRRCTELGGTMRDVAAALALAP